MNRPAGVDGSPFQALISCTYAVAAYGRSTQWQDAQQLFSSLPGMRISADLVAFNAGIAAGELAGRWSTALQQLRMMCRQTLPDSISYNSIISNCAKAAVWQWAVFLVRGMAAEIVIPNVITCSSAVSACEKRGCWLPAMLLFKYMADVDISPNIITCSSGIGACKGRWALALALLAFAIGQRLQANTVTYNTTVSACKDEFEIAQELLVAMRLSSVLADVITYNSLLSSCEASGQWRSALTLLDNMVEVQLWPDVVSLNSALGACARDGHWAMSLELLVSMPSQTLSADVVSYSSAISACEKAGMWQQALDLLEKMGAWLEVGESFCCIVKQPRMLASALMWARNQLPNAPPPLSMQVVVDSILNASSFGSHKAHPPHEAL